MGIAAALLPNRHPIVLCVPLTLLRYAVRGTREPILSTTLMRELTASDETEREREAIVLLERMIRICMIRKIKKTLQKIKL